MGSGDQSALRELRRLASRADSFGFEMERTPNSGTPRQAAVLILFGKLDRVLARSSVGTVPASLDVLLLRRSSLLNHHPGQVAFPGGGRESGDSSPSSTALREAEEETGLPPSAVTVLGELPEAMLPYSNNLVTPVLAWWHESAPLRADGAETAIVSRVPVADLLDPAARFTAVLRRGGAEYRGPMFKLGPEFGGVPLWGFTATILDRIFDMLEWTVPWDRERTFGVK